MPAKKMQRLIGRVQRTMPDKGYGFVVTDDHRKYFFHQTATETGEMPARNSLVEFEALEQTAEGMNDRAVNIRVLVGA